MHLSITIRMSDLLQKIQMIYAQSLQDAQDWHNIRHFNFLTTNETPKKFSHGKSEDIWCDVK